MEQERVSSLIKYKNEALTHARQLENDLAACKKHREEDHKTILNLTTDNNDLRLRLSAVVADLDAWKSAFKTISKLVK
jgi:hypothetical protein